MLAVAGAGLGATLWFAAQGVVYLLRTFVQPRWLWVLLAVNLVVLAVRAFAVADAYALERRLRPGPQRGRGWPARALLVLLVAAVIVPHAVLADYGLEAIGTLEALTVSEDLPSLEEREQELIDQGVSRGGPGPHHDRLSRSPPRPCRPTPRSGPRSAGSRRTTSTRCGR